LRLSKGGDFDGFTASFAPMTCETVSKITFTHIRNTQPFDCSQGRLFENRKGWGSLIVVVQSSKNQKGGAATSQ